MNALGGKFVSLKVGQREIPERLVVSVLSVHPGLMLIADNGREILPVEDSTDSTFQDTSEA
jgi:hypothetical protein